MKLIKFIMVTALIFIFGDVFAQQNTRTTEQRDRISYSNHGTHEFRCPENDSKCLSFNPRYLTCRPATKSDEPSQVAVECWCEASRKDSTRFSNKAIEYADDSSIDFIGSVSVDLCLTGLHNLIVKANIAEGINSCPVGNDRFCFFRGMDVTYSCFEPSVCFTWVDDNGNGVYDLGE